MTTYNHAYEFAFSLRSACKEGDKEKPVALRDALLYRILSLGGDEIQEAAGAPYDTYEETIPAFDVSLITLDNDEPGLVMRVEDGPTLMVSASSLRIYYDGAFERRERAFNRRPLPEGSVMDPSRYEMLANGVRFTSGRTSRHLWVPRSIQLTGQGIIYTPAGEVAMEKP